MKEPTVVEAHESYVLGLKFTADSQTLVSCGMDNVVKLWSAGSWEHIRTLKGHAHSVHTMALAPDEKTLVTGSSDKTVKLWSFPKGKQIKTLQDRKQVVSAVQISDDGEWIAAVSYGGRAMLWTMGGKPVVGIKANPKNLSSVAFSPDKKLLATCGLGDKISLWYLPTGALAAELKGHKTAVMHVRFVQDGRYLVSLGYEQTLKFWDTNSWKESRVLKPEVPSARGIVFSDDERLAALLLEGRVDIMSVSDWTKVQEYTMAPKSVASAAFSPDGKWLAVGAADRKIRIWPMGA
jgi:WD40 repeat protein